MALAEALTSLIKFRSTKAANRRRQVRTRSSSPPLGFRPLLKLSNLPFMLPVTSTAARTFSSVSCSTGCPVLVRHERESQKF